MKLLFELDKLSLEDRLRQIKLPPEQWSLVASFLDGMGSAPRQNCAYIDTLRWWALSGNDIGRLFDMTVRYRFRDGTISLINAMLADSNAEVKLSTPVSRIDQDAKQVRVTTETGRTYVGRMVIVTVPMNTLTGIEFSPPLDPRKVDASKQRMAGSGTKVWIKVKGKLPLVVAQAPGPQPFAFLFTEEQGPAGGYMIGFSSNRQWLDPKDKAAVAKAVHQFMPGLEVEEVLNYDWDLDPYSLGTWCVYRPGQASKYWRALRRPEGRIYFASADSALGWRGFIDGAIESGLHTGYLVTAALHKERHTKA
jgi:pseudooxynicotine dehydrogenase